MLLSGTAKPYRMHAFAPVNPDGANERSRDLTLATWCHANARKCDIRMALSYVHRESNYDAHRLPAGKTAAEEESATSCRSVSKTVRKSTTSIIQGISPLFEILEILGGLQTHRQVKR